MEDDDEKKFSRRELYERVWARPTRDVAKDIGVSDVAVAKACRKAGIPIPERGYWARKAASKPVVRRPLPPRFPGAADTISFGARHHYYYDNDWRRTLLDTEIPPEPTFEEPIEAVRDRIQKIVGRVRSERNFDRADPLISRCLAHDDERRKRYAKWQWASDLPKYESGIERRRLLILNSLFLAFRRCGCHPDMSTSKYQVVDNPEKRIVSVVVGDTRIHFCLEPASAKRATADARKKERLRLVFDSAGFRHQIAGKAWEDGEQHRLEDDLTEFVTATMVAGEERYRENLTSQRQHLIEQKARAERELAAEIAEQARLAQQAREREERQRVARLLHQASALRKAETIREYVRRVQNREFDMDIPEAALAVWSSWAIGEADRIDPVKNGTIANAANDLFVHQTSPE